MTEARYYLRGQTSIRDLEVDAMCTTSIHRLRDTGGFVYQGSPFSPIRTNACTFIVKYALECERQQKPCALCT